MAKAEPRIDEYTAKLVYRGRWIVPGHHVRSLPQSSNIRGWMLIMIIGEMGQSCHYLESCVYNYCPRLVLCSLEISPCINVPL